MCAIRWHKIEFQSLKERFIPQKIQYCIEHGKEKQNAKTHIGLQALGSYSERSRHNKEYVRDLFTRYSSGMQAYEMSRIQEEMRIESIPKTHSLFVASIIMMTVLGIMGLHTINPDMHSLGNYKLTLKHSYEQLQS